MTTTLLVLTSDEIGEALSSLPGWTYEANRLKKTFALNNFREAVSFIIRMAFEAEALNHHPEIFNVYNRVRVELMTHDAGDRVTAHDVKLARAIEKFSWV